MSASDIIRDVLGILVTDHSVTGHLSGKIHQISIAWFYTKMTHVEVKYLEEIKNKANGEKGNSKIPKTVVPVYLGSSCNVILYGKYGGSHVTSVGVYLRQVGEELWECLLLSEGKRNRPVLTTGDAPHSHFCLCA